VQTRFYQDQDQERRVSLFPLVASFPQGERQDEIVWLGAPQIREPFAQTLFRAWAPLAQMTGDAATPVVAWHTTQGQGYCLMRMVAEQGLWRISALLMSREDVIAMRCDPFLLLYGNALPAPDASRLRPAVQSLADLSARASQVLEFSFEGREMARARQQAQPWLDRLTNGERRVQVEARSYRELFLSAVSAWPELPLVKRMETSLVLAPPQAPPAHYLEPCLVLSAPSPRLAEVAARAPSPEPLPKAAPEEPARGRSISQEARIDITARFLAEADGGVDLSQTAMVRRIQSLEVVGDVASYRHLLDCLVCGLETRVERLSVGFVLDLLIAYSPATFALERAEVARHAFAEALLDVARLARVAEHLSSALCWGEGVLKHPSYEELMDAGLEAALRDCLRHSQEVALEKVLQQLQRVIPAPRWEDFRQRMTRQTGDFRALGQHEDTGVYARHRSTAEKQRHIAAHVDAIRMIAGAPLVPPRLGFPSPAPILDLEGRLMESWSASACRGPCLLWQGQGDAARLHLAALVQSATEEAEREAASSPLGISLLGPPPSVELLRHDIARLRERRPLINTHDHWAQPSRDEAFERAGVALRCTPLRNIWAAVSRQQGMGGKIEALLVHPREGGATWPRLIERISGVIFVVDAARLIREGSEVRQELREVLGMWEHHHAARPNAALQCAVLIAGVEALRDPVHAPLMEALRGAFLRIARERREALTERILTDMLKLGELTLHALDDGALETAMRARPIHLTAFAMPDPALQIPLHDIPLVWLMRACGMQLNLERGAHRPQWA
jgi:hypothetical protein